MDGFLLVDKPKGITSMTACNILKKRLGLSKCGHNGTLDPNTTGLLVVGCDNGTKLLKLINEHDKEYIATIVFGYDSNTLDIDGDITNQIDMNFTFDNLKEKLESLVKEETQIPPMTSAIKVNGKKLYEYQRKGINVEIKPRDIKIYEYEILGDLRNINNHLEIDIRLFVSKGFYVRSFARDLGKLLGGCAILKDLRRTKAGDFNITDSIKLDNICENNIYSIQDIFKFPIVEVNDYIAKLVKNGVMLDERQTTIKGVFYVKNKCDIIAIYEEVDELKYKPILIYK